MSTNLKNSLQGYQPSLARSQQEELDALHRHFDSQRKRFASSRLSPASVHMSKYSPINNARRSLIHTSEPGSGKPRDIPRGSGWIADMQIPSDHSSRPAVRTEIGVETDTQMNGGLNLPMTVESLNDNDKPLPKEESVILLNINENSRDLSKGDISMVSRASNIDTEGIRNARILSESRRKTRALNSTIPTTNYAPPSSSLIRGDLNIKPLELQSPVERQMKFAISSAENDITKKRYGISSVNIPENRNNYLNDNNNELRNVIGMLQLDKTEMRKELYDTRAKVDEMWVRELRSKSDSLYRTEPEIHPTSNTSNTKRLKSPRKLPPSYSPKESDKTMAFKSSVLQAGTALNSWEQSIAKREYEIDEKERAWKKLVDEYKVKVDIAEEKAKKYSASMEEVIEIAKIETREIRAELERTKIVTAKEKAGLEERARKMNADMELKGKLIDEANESLKKRQSELDHRENNLLNMKEQLGLMESELTQWQEQMDSREEKISHFEQDMTRSVNHNEREAKIKAEVLAEREKVLDQDNKQQEIVMRNRYEALRKYELELDERRQELENEQSILRTMESDTMMNLRARESDLVQAESSFRREVFDREQELSKVEDRLMDLKKLLDSRSNEIEMLEETAKKAKAKEAEARAAAEKMAERESNAIQAMELNQRQVNRMHSLLSKSHGGTKGISPSHGPRRSLDGIPTPLRVGPRPVPPVFDSGHVILPEPPRESIGNMSRLNYNVHPTANTEPMSIPRPHPISSIRSSSPVKSLKSIVDSQLNRDSQRARELIERQMQVNRRISHDLSKSAAESIKRDSKEWIDVQKTEMMNFTTK